MKTTAVAVAATALSERRTNLIGRKTTGETGEWPKHIAKF